MAPWTPRGFYAILDLRDEAIGVRAELVRRARALLDAAPCCLQLRAKRASTVGIYEAARVVQPLCREAGVLFCMNDRVDLALATDADIVHVGQDDLPLADVRRLLTAAGRPLQVGVSTHNLTQARAAAAGGADYIGFGPVFGTSSKDNPDPVVGLDGLAAVCRAVPVPVVAIGGITRAEVAAVRACGAAAAAVISDIDRAVDPAAAAREVAALFSSTAI